MNDRPAHWGDPDDGRPILHQDNPETLPPRPDDGPEAARLRDSMRSENLRAIAKGWLR